MGPWGALLRRELLSRMRTVSHFVMRTVYVGVLFMVVVALGQSVLLSNLGEPVSFAPGLGRLLFVSFGFAQYALVVVLVPLVSAGAVVEERVEGSLQLLFLTKLTPWQIAAGKFLARLGLVALLVLSNVPVLAFAAMLGGVEPVDVLRVFSLTLGTAAMLTGWGLVASAFCQSTVRAAMVIYLGLVALTASLLCLLGVDVAWFLPWHPMLSVYMALAEPLSAAPWWWVATLVDVGLGALGVLVTTLLLRWDARKARLFDGSSVAGSGGGAGVVWDNPIVWRGWARQGRFWPWLLLGLAAGLVHGGVIVWCDTGGEGEVALIVGDIIIMSTMVLMCIAVGANAFAQEKREQTLDLLRLTKLTPWDIVVGKSVSILRLVLIFIAAIQPGMWASLLVLEQVNLGLLLFPTLGLVLVGFFVGALSMFYSLVSATPMHAALPSVALIFYVSAPMYLWPMLVFQHEDFLLVCLLLGWSLVFVPPMLLIARARPAAMPVGMTIVGGWVAMVLVMPLFLEQFLVPFTPSLIFLMANTFLLALGDSPNVDEHLIAGGFGASQVLVTMVYYLWAAVTLFDARLEGLASEEEESPKLAALLSAVIPGAGQIYLGHSVRGGVIMTLSMLFVCCAGLANIAAAIDAHRLASDLRERRRARSRGREVDLIES